MASVLNTLSIDKKIQLVEDLWDSIAANQDALPITQEQKSELDSRLAAYELDGVKVREAHVAIAEIKKKL